MVSVFYYLLIIAFQAVFCFSSSVLCYNAIDNLSCAIGQFDRAQAPMGGVCSWCNGIPSHLSPVSRILAVRELRVSQGYGDPLYKRFYDFTIVRFYGALNFSFAMRTRQDVVAQTIGSYLFPSQCLPDVEGQDINAHAKTVIQAQLSRFGVFFNPFAGMTECDIYGILEMDFGGVSLDTQYTAKLRHAFGEIVWNSGAFLFGQYYHPLFLKECFPRTIDFNMGAPYEPQGIMPQIRLSQRFGPVEFAIAVSSESYIQSYGPLVGIVSVPSISFIQDAMVPDCSFLAKFIIDSSFYGGAFDYKRLVPRLASDNNYKVNEYLDSFIWEAFAHNVFSWGELNLKFIYSQNGSDQLLISGFAVRTQEPITNKQTYVNTAALSGWLDVFWLFYNQEMSLGLFVGGAKNLGAKNSLFINPTTNQPVVFAVNSIAQNVSYSARISPRFVFARDAFRFGFECSWNGISYGCLDDFAQVVDPVPVGSFEYTVALDYVF